MDEDIAKLRELLATAPPAPWSVDKDWTFEVHGPTGLLGKFIGPGVNLIVALRNTAPELLDELERLRAENRKYLGQLAQGYIHVVPDPGEPDEGLHITVSALKRLRRIRDAALAYAETTGDSVHDNATMDTLFDLLDEEETIVEAEMQGKEKP